MAVANGYSDLRGPAGMIAVQSCSGDQNTNGAWCSTPDNNDRSGDAALGFNITMPPFDGYDAAYSLTITPEMSYQYHSEISDAGRWPWRNATGAGNLTIYVYDVTAGTVAGSQEVTGYADSAYGYLKTENTMTTGPSDLTVPFTLTIAAVPGHTYQVWLWATVDSDSILGNGTTADQFMTVLLSGISWQVASPPPTRSFGSAATPVQLHDANGGCLDLPGGNTANGTKLQIWACDGDGWDQTWYLDGGAIHYAANPGKCIDLPDGNQVDGAQLQLWDCDNGASQDQQWLYGADGTLKKWSNGAAGKCVELLNGSASNGNIVHLYDCNGTSGQTWFPLLGSAAHPVQIHDANGGCLDLPNGNTTNGTVLQIWACDGDGLNQTWYMDAAGAVHFGASPGKCLDLPSGNQVDGARLQLWDCDNGASQDQQWIYEPNGSLRKWSSGAAGKCVELLNGSASNGNAVQLYGCNGTSGQDWYGGTP